MSEEGIQEDPAKIAAVQNWPVPKNVKEVRQFLGFTGYYPRFVKGFAEIVRPLNDLLVGHYTNPQARKESRNQSEKVEYCRSKYDSFLNRNVLSLHSLVCSV